MSYEVLARKWRPRLFEDLVGQEHVIRALVNALDTGRLHHAFLFTGTRGIGKTTIARILAKSLNCDKGVSSRPCGECLTCREVDEGRFVDLIEVDAASRTKVDDTRELLDNVQYAPTRGRYKVYLIDEVHMLSGHSFNALLKTLEEPPPHVKFLLATTDPQKVPVTVLSRCLQFNLKRLSGEQIAGQLQKILLAEDITCDGASVALLARAADGSMRDALSLLDQAIAFGGGKLVESEVRDMLGTLDQDSIERLLQALAANNPQGLLSVVAGIAEHGGDYEAALDGLLLALHRVSLAQVDPALASKNNEQREQVLVHAGSLSREDVQLYYQIGLHGKRDLPLSPDPRTGLEMVLLRMLAFRPAPAPGIQRQEGPVSAGETPSAKAGRSEPKAVSNTAPVETRGWSDIVEQLDISGILRQLADHCVMETDTNGRFVLVLDEAYGQLHSREREAELKQKLEAFYGEPVKLTFRIGRPASETPAKEKSRMQDERQQAAEQAIADDPNVRALQQNFNARVRPDSVRSKP